MDEQTRIANALGKWIKENVPAEMIGGTNLDDAAEMVMLEIEHTPVCPDPFNEESMHIHHRLPKVCEATPTAGGNKYIVDGEYVSAEELKRMRARYLLLRGYLMELIVKHRLSHPVQQLAISRFFDGELFVPQALVDIIKAEGGTR